jgi:predicted amidohydrolase
MYHMTDMPFNPVNLHNFDSLYITKSELKTPLNCDTFSAMKIGLVQSTSFLGDVAKNLESHMTFIRRAEGEKIDLLIFPELSLTGYTLKDLVRETALHPSESPVFAQLKEASRKTAMVVGFVEEKEKGLFYNSAAFLAEGRVLHIHRKVFLPTYGMFEEKKFFAEGKDFTAFSTPFATTGLMVCYDFLHYGACYLLFTGGADMIITLSAAPGRGIGDGNGFESSRMWEIMGESISRFSTAFVVYCNRAGHEDGKFFAGGSFIYGPSGRLLAKAPYLDEAFLVQDIDLDEVRGVRQTRHYNRDNKPEIIYHALGRILQKNED